jgi:uncharacterized membrane protein
LAGEDGGRQAERAQNGSDWSSHRQEENPAAGCGDVLIGPFPILHSGRDKKLQRHDEES